MFSHHDIDHRDVRVHFAKRQFVQDLSFSSCLTPNPQDRHLGLAKQSLLHSWCCFFVSLQEQTDPCVAVMSRLERSSGRLSRLGSPRVCLIRLGFVAGVRLVFTVLVA